MEIHDSFDTNNLCGEQIRENVTHAYHGTMRERGPREASDTNASVSRLVGQDNEIHVLLMHESTTFSIFT